MSYAREHILPIFQAILSSYLPWAKEENAVQAETLVHVDFDGSQKMFWTSFTLCSMEYVVTVCLKLAPTQTAVYSAKCTKFEKTLVE